MDALALTHKHERKWLPLDQLEENPDNPNKMRQREFDALVETIMEEGCTQDIEVRRIAADKYRIIGGAHRYKALKYLEWVEGPCIINNNPNMDESREAAQLMKLNAIHGQVDPDAFVKLYEKTADGRTESEMQAFWGFADEKEFQKLLKSTKKALPKDLQDQFAQAAKEIKTLDELANVLNQILSQSGDSLSYGYMVFDFEGRESVWLRMQKKDLQHFRELGAWCMANGRAMDDLLSFLVQSAVDSDEEYHDYLRAEIPEIDYDLPNHILPTHDAIGES